MTNRIPGRSAWLSVLGIALGAMGACESLQNVGRTEQRDIRLATLDDFVNSAHRSKEQSHPPDAAEQVDASADANPADPDERSEPGDETVAAATPESGSTDASSDDMSSNANAAPAGGGLRLGSGTPPGETASTGNTSAESPDSVQAALQPGRRVLVDSLIGEIHGRPVFADTFFAPIEDRLRAEARKAATSRQFSAQATNIIAQRLRELIINELVLAEAESSLTEQEQQGLIGWIRDMQERVAAGAGGGSEYAARRRIAEEEGKSFEQYIQQLRDEALIRRLVQQQIQPRVIVSWRDVEREYQRNYQRYNPPPVMTVGRISLGTEREAEKVEQAETMFADGLPFAEVADAIGQPDAENWQQFELPPGGIDEIGLNETIRNKLKQLDVGETSEPFEIGSSTWWLHITKLEQPPGRSLYEPDVQRELMNRILQRRQDEEEQRYIQELFSEGISDDFESMARRLVNIAERRYGP